jgi:hypothetical protein
MFCSHALSSMIYINLQLFYATPPSEGPSSVIFHPWTPAWHFLDDAERAQAASSSLPPLNVPWSVWGPTRTRWSDDAHTLEDLESINTTYLEGSRIVTDAGVFDFAPLATKIAAYHAKYDSAFLAAEPTVTEHALLRHAVVS